MLTELDMATYGNEEADKELENLRGLLLWALYNHQGGNSTIGQPIRKALGIGKFDRLTSEQIEKAQIAAGIIDVQRLNPEAMRSFIAQRPQE